MDRSVFPVPARWDWMPVPRAQHRAFGTSGSVVEAMALIGQTSTARAKVIVMLVAYLIKGLGARTH